MTRHGCAERAAHSIKNIIGESTDLVNLRIKRRVDISAYDTVIIGGSIHAGMVQKRVRKFCEKNKEKLLQKRLGLYLCCMYEGETAGKQFEEAFEEELRRHAVATGLFGGEFNFAKMNFIERRIVTKIADITESISRIDEKAIGQFAGKFL
jgi:menaquinone-dependent protoporphyrinogen oxidase